MVAGGGGSWKVAYADFVTAMMAFFLVMWICGQDRSTRESIAHYFNEPYQFFRDPVGGSRSPDKKGAIFKGKNSGAVPDSDKSAMAHGREGSTQKEPSRATKTVSDWAHGDEKTAKYWGGKAKEALKTASRYSGAGGDKTKIEEEAARILGDQLKKELGGEPPTKNGENLQNDLLRDVLNDVNWTEVAEDFLRNEQFPDASPFP